MVNTIWFLLELIRSRKTFSVCVVLQRWHFSAGVLVWRKSHHRAIISMKVWWDDIWGSPPLCSLNSLPIFSPLGKPSLPSYGRGDVLAFSIPLIQDHFMYIYTFIYIYICVYLYVLSIQNHFTLRNTYTCIYIYTYMYTYVCICFAM